VRRAPARLGLLQTISSRPTLTQVRTYSNTQNCMNNLWPIGKLPHAAARAHEHTYLSRAASLMVRQAKIKDQWLRDTMHLAQTEDTQCKDKSMARWEIFPQRLLESHALIFSRKMNVGLTLPLLNVSLYQIRRNTKHVLQHLCASADLVQSASANSKLRYL